MYKQDPVLCPTFDIFSMFLQHPEFSYLLKERVCPLIIKLFSPNIKFKQGGTGQATVVEKPVFPVSMRLLRIVSILIKQFYTLLVSFSGTYRIDILAIWLGHITAGKCKFGMELVCLCKDRDSIF